VVNAFFKEFRKEVDPKVHVVMFWDQAGFHTSGKLKPPKNLTLIPLPPQCPELNPIENLWHHLRSHHWSNHAYDDYDALQQAACDAWHASCLDTTTIQSVCRCSYLVPDKREVRA
jgi:transposase